MPQNYEHDFFFKFQHYCSFDSGTVKDLDSLVISNHTITFISLLNENQLGNTNLWNCFSIPNTYIRYGVSRDILQKPLLLIYKFIKTLILSLNIFKNCFSQTGRSRELAFWENAYTQSCITCHLWHIMCHMSFVPCQIFFCKYIQEFFLTKCFNYLLKGLLPT